MYLEYACFIRHFIKTDTKVEKRGKYFVFILQKKSIARHSSLPKIAAIRRASQGAAKSSVNFLVGGQ